MTVTDVQELIDVKCCHEDQTINEHVRKVHTFKAQHIVKRINVGITEIRRIWPEATGPELYVAFEMCQESIEDMIESIQEEAFRNKVGIETHNRLHPPKEQPVQQKKPEQETDNEDDEDDDDDFVCRAYDQDRPKSKGKASDKKQPAPKIVASDLCCPDDVDAKQWASWSDARKISYVQGERHPNAYYYRHLPKGEKQKNGAWSPDEKTLFFKRMKELRGNATTFGHDWGLFSLAIPGRVGYQCSNFYRLLLESGEMTDSSYVRGDDGKLHHISRVHDGKVTSKKRKGKREEKDIEIVGQDRSRVKTYAVSDVNTFRLYRAAKGPIQSRRSAEHDRSEEDEAAPSTTLSRYEMWALQNPLPDKTDFITGDIIRVPAISPSGYVLDYNTWIESLSEKSVDPFTGQHLTKRQLVVITTENYPEYADKIRNL